MEITPGTIADLIILAFFLIEVIHGWFVGLALKAMHLLVIIVSAAIAAAVAQVTGMWYLTGIVFVVAVFVLNRAALIVRVVDAIPVIGTLNRIGGAFVGFVAAFAVVYVIVTILFAATPQEMWDEIGLTKKVIDRTYLLKALL